MQGHRHQQHLFAAGLRLGQRCHEPGHCSGERDLAAVFQSNGDLARNLAISDGGAGPRDPRGPGEAGAALTCLGYLERQATCRAARISQEFNLRPAFRAEAVHLSDDRAAGGAARREEEIEQGATDPPGPFHGPACRAASRIAQAPEMPSLFDPQLRAQRRDRAARRGPELFLHERAFGDMIERIELIGRRFGPALILGCPDRQWRDRLEVVAGPVRAVDPGPLFAAALGEAPVREEALDVAPASLDLILAAGTLDTIDDLPGTLLRLSLALRPGGLLIGAVAGGDSLPRLRSAMRAADEAGDGAQAHVHPRVEAAALAPLLEQANLKRPVIDVDKVQIAYASLWRLVEDLRAMAATNVLSRRARPMSRAMAAAAAAEFAASADARGRTIETVEILHFAAWRDPV